MNRGSTTPTMKLVMTILVCLFAVGVSSTAEAQTFELTPFAGWRFGGGFEDLATGGCAIAFSGSGLVQGELTAGLQIPF